MLSFNPARVPGVKRAATVLLTLLTACSSPSEPGPSTTASTVAATDPPPVPTTTGPAETTTTTEALPPGPVLGLVTETGVPVAVLTETTAGYIVIDNCGDRAYTTGGEPIYQVDVVLDPGHGGPIDTGAVGRNGLIEKELNLAVAVTVQIELEERGISSVLTRTADYAVVLRNRAAFADHLGPEALVSIHHNAPTPGPSDVPGTEVFVQSGSPHSHRLGGLIWEHTVDALSAFDVAWTAAPDTGVLTVLHPNGNDAYGMIRSPETVSVLAELAYLSNPAEAELLATAEYVDAVAVALTNAIEAYLGSDDPGDGFVAEPRVFRPNPGLRSDNCEAVALD